MKAVVLTSFGKGENLKLSTLPDPTPGPGEVLLRVKACALNHLDLWIRGGLPTAKISLPFILGSDAAGEIVALGKDVKGFEIGSKYAVHPGRSCGQCRACQEDRLSDCLEYGILGAYGGHTGAYAELLVVPIQHLLPMPSTMSFVDAAACPLTFLTAWHMLMTLGKLEPGETVLIVGIGAGVACAALSIAKWRGANIIVSSTSAQKLEKAIALGANDGILTFPEEMSRSIRKKTHAKMVDLVFEHVGGNILPEALKCLRRSGRLVTCGATSGAQSTLDIRYVFDRQLKIFGARMGGLLEMKEVWNLVSSGKLKPTISQTFALPDAALAHEALSSKSHFGKIVLTL